MQVSPLKKSLRHDAGQELSRLSQGLEGNLMT